MTDPIKQIAHPSFPSVPNSSFRKYDPNTAPIKTLNAPNGVTNIAGANAYAAKFAISPIMTDDNVSHILEYGGFWARTSYYTRPPYGTFEIRKSISLKTMSFFCVYKPLYDSQKPIH
jgi:hypothetical protein